MKTEATGERTVVMGSQWRNKFALTLLEQGIAKRELLLDPTNAQAQAKLKETSTIFEELKVTDTREEAKVATFLNLK